ncbi:TerC/Alx family metal homeostasis membrane protein [Phosphitispora sp. TUW77]|uniref:TerC/Alx family metal homeostasis membrane protein n=1 Tax=Phosphitispora sp. TUW77 TaxID=3152361 RepID=UPI003AB79261
MSIRSAVRWVVFWIILALTFNAGIYFFLGKQQALEFLGGYIIELSLSLDNLFLFLIIFSSCGIKPVYQRRVLNWGIFGAVILRMIFVVLGVSIVNRFHWVLYIFGIILILSGIKMFFSKEAEGDYKNNFLTPLLSKIIPISPKLEGEKFFVKINGILHATPLFAVLVAIEGSDVLFAIDSIPAIFSVTTDPLIVYASNIFAILGLRNLYFILERLHNAFRFVTYGVATILTFTGIKLSILFFNIEIPLTMSIGIIFTVIMLSIIASVLFPGLEVSNEHQGS